jgi:hypothetical protein
MRMDDRYSAGRFWITSSASGESVEAAIQYFVNFAGGDPKLVVGHLPPRLRLPRLENYSESVRERLNSLGLAEAILLDQNDEEDPPESSWGHKLVGVLLLSFLLLMISSCCLGFIDIVRWTLVGE